MKQVCYSRGQRDLSAIFPEELWEMVLENLENGEDIITIFIAFPQLGSLFNRKKGSCLFDQVFPHIFKHISHNLKDYLTCRLVCRRWCNVIDIFLEDHPSRRPYANNNLSRRQMQYSQFSYQDLSKDVKTISCLEVTTVERIQELTESMSEHPRNPFIGRKLKFVRQFDSDSTNEENGLQAKNFLKSTKEFLKIFGHHMWNVDLYLGHFFPTQISVAEFIFADIVECLSYLPNVRSLGIGFHFVDVFISHKEFKSVLDKHNAFSTLPHLDTVRLLNCLELGTESFGYFVKLLCGRIAIKKLAIPTSLLKHRCQKYSPNLTELVVDMRLFLLDQSCPHQLKELESFHGLRKLRIQTAITGKKLRVEDILSYISRLQVEELEILQSGDDTISSQSKGYRKALPLISSLKYLRIYDAPKLNFNFLNSFPSLKHLQILMNLEVEEKRIHQNKIVKRYTLTDIIRSYVYEDLVPKDVNIWNTLPCLEMLTVDNYCLKQFLKEYGNKCFRTSVW